MGQREKHKEEEVDWERRKLRGLLEDVLRNFVLKKKTVIMRRFSGGSLEVFKIVIFVWFADWKILYWLGG